MKTITKFLFFAGCFSLLFSCQKSDQFSDELQGVDLKSAAKNCGEVIVLNPSGGDDTQALKDAFEEANQSGPGATVQLTEGTYTIGMIEVRDFNGCFMGAGKGKTFISNLSGLPCEEMLAIDNCPYLMQFVGGNVNISDLTFLINDGKPCADGPNYTPLFTYTLCTVLVLADFTSTYVPDNRQIIGVVKNVDFIAGKSEGDVNHFGTDGNVNMSLYCGAPFWYGTGTEPLSNGQILVTGCRFERNYAGPDFAAFGENSTINIENNVIIENAVGLYMFSNLGSNFIVKNNKFLNCLYLDFFIEDNDYGYYPNVVLQNRTEWNIFENEFQSSPGVVSLYLSDFRRSAHREEGFPQLFNIKGNVIHTSDGGTAILGLNSKDAKIWNNKFLGNGAAGVWIEGDEISGIFAENILMLGNNFSNLTSSVANIYLGEKSKDCTIIGSKTDGNVVDNGVDNKITGMKMGKSGLQLGPTIRNNLMMTRKMHK